MYKNADGIFFCITKLLVHYGVLRTLRKLTISGYNAGLDNRHRQPGRRDFFQKTLRRSIDEGKSVSLPDTPSSTLLRAYLGPNWNAAPLENADFNVPKDHVSFQTINEFSQAYIQYIVRNAITVLTGQPPEATPTDRDFSKVSKIFIHEIADSQPLEPLPQKSSDSKDNITEKESTTSISVKSDVDNFETRAAWCVSHKTYDIGNRNEFERFKRFIRGTLGERFWWLWMDIERLKVLKDSRRQKRYFLFEYVESHL